MAASVRATTVGATAPCSTVVLCAAARAAGANTSFSAAPPAAPTTAAPTALMKIFLRLGSLPRSFASVPSGAKTASPELGSRPG